MSPFEPIEGYDGYLISKEGEVWSERSNKLLSPFPDKKGYLLCNLYLNGKRKQHKIHRLVALTFIPNPENKPQVNHIDGNKSNNHISNLEWASPKENIKHAWNSGLANSISGVRRTDSKLSEEDLKYIRENYVPKSKEFGGRAMASKFGVSPSVISNVVNGKTYKENQ